MMRPMPRVPPFVRPATYDDLVTLPDHLVAEIVDGELHATPYCALAPDWICEILSPSTASLDRSRKLGVYAREQVAHAWLVDPLLRTLEVLPLEGGRVLYHPDVGYSEPKAWSPDGTHILTVSLKKDQTAQPGV
jgi:Uma2 family endonuclease